MSDASTTNSPEGKGQTSGAAGEKRTIHESNAQSWLDTLLNSANLAVVLVDAQGVLTAWNLGAQALFGYSAAEALGKPLATFFCDPSAAELDALLARVARHAEAAVVRAQGIHKQSAWPQVTLTLIPHRAGAQAEIQVLGVLQPGSASALSDAAAPTPESTFSQVFHTTPDAIIISRLVDGLILEANQGFETASGYLLEEVQGKSSLGINLWCDPRDRERFAQAMLENGQVTNLEARYRRKDGEIRDFLISGRLIEINGEACILSVGRDITDRNIREEERKKFMLGMERSGEAMFITNPEGVITYVNPTFEKIYGYSRQEAIGQTPRLLKSGAQSQEIYQSFWETILARNTYYGEFINKTRDGRLIHVEVSANPILDQEGGTIGYLAIQRDITDRKQAEQALRESEEKYRQLFELESDTLLLVDNESGQILEANSAATEMYGYSHQELLSMRIVDLSGEPEETRRATSEKITWIPVRYHRKKDGSNLPVEITLRHFNRGGRSVHVAAIRDITERLRIEEEITQQRSRFQQLFQNAPIGIVMLDCDDRILSINPAFEAIFGFNEADLAGKSLSDAIVPPSLRAESDQLNADVLHGATIQQETLRARKDGTLIHVQVYGIPIIDEGAITGVYGMYMDITARKQVEEKLQYLSNHDPLTGLFNRFYLDEEMARLEHSRQYPVSIIMLDVDEMKDTNDTRGHAEGDALLKRAANLLRSTFRAEDVVARIGGDEFVVLLPETEHETALAAMQRVRELLASHNRAINEPRLAISMGVSTAAPGDSLAETLRLADQNMYQDKATK